MNPNNNNDNNSSGNNRPPVPSSVFSFGFQIGSNGRVMQFGNIGPNTVPTHFRRGDDAVPIFPHFEGPAFSSSSASSNHPFMNQHPSPLFNLLNPNVHANNPFSAMLQQLMFQAMEEASTGGSSTNYNNATSIDSIAAQLFAQHQHTAPDRPTASSVLDSLKEVTITDDDIKEKKACAVCMSDFTKNETGVVELPCPGHHRFHKTDCLLPWLRTNNTCPVCRFELKSQGTESSGNGTSSSTSTTTRRRRSFMDVLRGRHPSTIPTTTTDGISTTTMNNDHYEEIPYRRSSTRNEGNDSTDSDEEVMDYIAQMFGINHPHNARTNNRNQSPYGISLDTSNLSNTDNDFDEAELQAAMQASLNDSPMVINSNHSNDNNNYRSTSASSTIRTNNNERDDNMEDTDEYTQVVLSSLRCLSDTELQIQCADALIDIDPSRNNDREYLIERLAIHNGVPYIPLPSNSKNATQTTTGKSSFPVSISSSSSSSSSVEPIIRFTDIVQVPLEPSSMDDPDVCTIRIRLPDSTYITRRFDKRDTVSQIAAWIISLPEKRSLFTIDPKDGSPRLRLRIPIGSSSLTTTTTPSEGITMGINDGNSTKALTVFDSSSWFIEIERTSLGKRATLIAEAY